MGLATDVGDARRPDSGRRGDVAAVGVAEDRSLRLGEPRSGEMEPSKGLSHESEVSVKWKGTMQDTLVIGH